MSVFKVRGTFGPTGETRTVNALIPGGGMPSEEQLYAATGLYYAKVVGYVVNDGKKLSFAPVKRKKAVKKRSYFDWDYYNRSAGGYKKKGYRRRY